VRILEPAVRASGGSSLFSAESWILAPCFRHLAKLLSTGRSLLCLAFCVSRCSSRLNRLSLVAVCPLAYGQAVSQGSGDLRVMTYNANEGKDYLEVERATTSSQFLIAVGQTITQVSATDPPAHAGSRDTNPCGTTHTG